MNCNHCRANVENAIKSVAGVTKVEVSLERGEAQVWCECSAEEILKTVDASGYECEVRGR